MDAISINRKRKIYSIKEMNIALIAEEGDRMLVVFNGEENYRLAEGQRLVFRRYVYGDGAGVETITTAVTILEKAKYGKKDAVYTTIPDDIVLRLPVYYGGRLSIKKGPQECVDDYDAYFDETHRYLVVKIGDNYHINDWCYYYNTLESEYFIVEFDTTHNIFAQDAYFVNNILNTDYSIEVRNGGNGKIGQFEGVAVALEGLPREARKSDTLTKVSGLTNCGKMDEDWKYYKTEYYRYTFAPSAISRRRIIFSGASTTQTDGDFFTKVCYLIENGERFVPRYNPFYYYVMDGSDKRYRLWSDPWWTEFDSKNGRRPLKEVYFKDGDSRCTFGVENDYWNVPMVTFSNDEFSLGTEEDQGREYVDSSIDSVIPDVIDMERFKYAPAIFDGEDYSMAKSITFDLHFRKRETKDIIKSSVAENGGYPIYEDGWYISENSGNTVWWNGMNYDGNEFDATRFKEFYEEKGRKSDLLGYLGFDDEDVYYRKAKVVMSFIRLSFYTSPDPMEQKLLYYSTSFLDATSLYGKYMKQSSVKYGKYGEYETTPLLFYPYDGVSARVDTEICIKNEFNNLASSEGFNLYLFGDDADKVDEGKPYRTIYMKIEFNHAGNGKTIPMVMWPKDENGEYRPITIDSFLKDLYIPIRIQYIDGKFVYSIPSAENENGNIRIVLFEPKISYETI